MIFLQPGILIITGFLSGAALTRLIIPFLKKMRTGQTIREEGPSSHQAKAGTPTMGGAALIAAVVFTCLITRAVSAEMLIILISFVLFGLLGFLDDYIKVTKRHNLGLRAWQKLMIQVVISVLIAAYLSYFSIFGTMARIPAINEFRDFGIWYVPFITFVIVAMVNSVNLTDGLDGLAAGATSIAALFFAVTGTVLGLSGGGSFCAALTGACLGFLIYNRNPARVFMGDTGSLALGGGLAVAAITMGMELYLPIVGFVYVAEALSVIIQVVSFKTTGRRVFKMSPLHHHFELLGAPEKRVVVMFWVFTAACCLAGLKLL